MGLNVSVIDQLPMVEAQLNYLVPMNARPRTYTYDPPLGAPRSNISSEPRRVAIRDMRPIAGGASLDRQGFLTLRHDSAVSDFHDDEEVRRIYYPEAERLIREVTGAARVLVFDQTVRRYMAGAEDRRSAYRQPVARVHVDYTETSGPQRVRDLLGEDADSLLRGRVQIINVWRPIRGPVLDQPLAVCDALSVDPHDLVASDLVYPNRIGEIYSVTYNPNHRWFYLPKMTTDEVILLKCFDCKADGRARFVPHSAFADPSAPPDAPPRQSIELRTLVFHPN